MTSQATIWHKPSTWLCLVKGCFQGLWTRQKQLWSKLKRPSWADVLQVFKDAGWSTTIGLAVTGFIVVVITIYADKTVSGLDPRIRAWARSTGLREGVEMCVFGPVNYDGHFGRGAPLFCETSILNVPFDPLYSKNKDGLDYDLSPFASFLAVLFDCGFVDSVYNQRFLTWVLTASYPDGMTAAEACQKGTPEVDLDSDGTNIAKFAIAYSVNDTVIGSLWGDDQPQCVTLPAAMHGKELPPDYPGN
jgi:hypothetical protein